MNRRTSTFDTNLRLIGPLLKAAALMLAVSLLLAGCGSDDGTGEVSSGPTADPTVTPPPATATTEPERPTGFLGQHGVYASFAPADLELYRALLPAQFDMPDQPQVIVFLADYYDINIPLAELNPGLGLRDMVPYLEGAVALQSVYNGRSGLHVITMPVDDKTANDAGRAMGFPKYVADEITLEKADGGWAGAVVHEGRTMLGMRFTSLPDATPQEGGGGGARLFQLIPPGEGPEVNQVNLVSSSDTRSEAVAGTATIEFDPEAEWAGLIPDGSVGAVFRETTGASNLGSSTPE